jgi:glycosyltransferase involved in cell wall biosynthesis
MSRHAGPAAPNRLAAVEAGRPRQIIVCAPNVRDVSARSGIHRVIIGLVSALPRFISVDLAKWDPIDGQLRYFDMRDFRALFRSVTWPQGLAINPNAHRISYRFADTIPPGTEVCVLMPEPFYHEPDGNDVYRRVISQCLAAGWTTAAILYDLIPIHDPRYGLEAQHRGYVAELLRVDNVICISDYARDDLWRFLDRTVQLTPAELETTEQRIVSVRLPEAPLGPVASHTEGAAGQPARDVIVMVGAVEPRKQQLRVIRAFQKLQIGERAQLKLAIVGSLHHLVAREFETLIAGDRNIEYLGYASEQAVAGLFRRARFSVFASRMEGYGLPIVESLARGVPCLTANFGAMAETASGGGCLAVNVDDDGELERGLLELALDDALITKLRTEIGDRAPRTWDDYALDLIAALTWSTPGEQALAIQKRLIAARPAARPRAAWRQLDYRPGELTANTPALTLGIAAGLPPEESGRDANSAADDAVRAVLFTGEPGELADAPPALLARFFSADAFGASRAALDQLVRLAEQHRYEGMLPAAWLESEAGRTPSWDRFCGILSTLLAAQARRRLIAQREGRYRTLWRRIADQPSDPGLTIIISAYNAGHFLERNVAWILAMIAPLHGRVRLIVADNASTDDTPRRMERFSGEPLFEYLRAPANTGLLGNLNFCSTLLRDRYVWIIGADDIIVPGALRELLAHIENEPACPFIFLNFGVYHREAIGAEESCESLISDYILLGRDASPTGLYPIKDIAVQHDNLFTAFYTMIFRSDMLAAVFNSPFTGRFFGSVMETVPTTEVILKQFAEVKAIWHAAPAIIGNAHNSWRHNRVAWHGVIMPLVFEMARQAGVRQDFLREWSKQHVDLFREAERLFPDRDVASRFGQAELDASFRVFRRRLFESALPEAQPAPGPANETAQDGAEPIASQRVPTAV